MSPCKVDDNLSKLYLPLGYKDVFLSYNYEKKVSALLGNLVGGDELIVDLNACYDRENNKVLIFFKKFKKDLQSYLDRGYTFSTARVRHVVFWKAEDAESDTRVLLPIIELKKTTDSHLKKPPNEI